LSAGNAIAAGPWAGAEPALQQPRAAADVPRRRIPRRSSSSVRGNQRGIAGCLLPSPPAGFQVDGLMGRLTVVRPTRVFASAGNLLLRHAIMSLWLLPPARVRGGGCSPAKSRRLPV